MLITIRPGSGALVRLAAVAAVAASAWVQPATARSVEKAVGHAGPFTIHSISEAGRFDRCAADLVGASGTVRLSWDRNHDYSISVPAPKTGGTGTELRLATDRGVVSHEAIVEGGRARAKLDNAGVEALIDTRVWIVVDFGGDHHVWPIGTTRMGDVFVEMENCVWRAQGR